MAHPVRRVRQRLTTSALNTGRAAAPWLPRSAITVIERAVGRAGRWLPVLSRMVADNMRAAGVYSCAAHRAYFMRSAQHLAGLLHVFRHAGERRDAGGAASGTVAMSPGLARVVEARVGLDASFSRLREAYALGRGVVLLGAHPVNFMLALARMNQELPITVYQRYSKDPRREEARRRFCEICGLSFVAEPPSATNPARRAERMADALRAGRILVITPDLVQNREEGVPTRFFDREVYLPGGAAALALVVDAPLVTVLARPASDQAITLTFHGPLLRDASARGKGWRQEATRERIQWFADLMVEEFLKPHPELWFLWGDKRWTRVFRGDSRYTRPLSVADRGSRIAD